MTAIFIGIILSELNILDGWILFFYIIYLVWRIGYKISLLRP